ncbi:MAG TPA: class I SAM-dependent methyltransferase, partial [Anaerolineae bacterium]|nr:class I SAM-dependent methyltransferase [Anaerolineae bacterium]
MLTKLWWRLVGFGFRLLYYEMAWTYDVVSWVVSLGAWRSWARAALPYVVGKRVVEVGHGPGHLLADLAEVGYEVVGVDLSPYMGRLAVRRWGKRGLAGRAPVVRGRGEGLP